MKLNLGQPVPCTECKFNMMLTTDEERERGWCIYCGMTKFRHLSGFKLITDTERVVYRSEPNCYGQTGVVDDD